MDLAETIARLDIGKPKQSHLRRAISTAYYSLFHDLTDEVCKMIRGSKILSPLLLGLEGFG